MSEIHTDDSLKVVREALCVAQTAIGIFWTQPNIRPRHIETLQNLIDDIDRQRPIGTDGKHGNLHTPTCGCEDKP
ncbi:hypothetical protein [Rhodococcus pyridinivorans]|uniref:Uncharacterized protein n=1 Tax=Rhodococcus pyridinivorans AK37 TaxID=1114960 RepID=H0JL63_9NOCA|nr:hypothetical protein [Rhodococcus pyridinivorans]EHK86398.1 hypothetical protein AK37_01582 [Rhodococcus pyridinivorans AK37]MCD2139511.1 hypothetical protein [Rhodococcus pyridinivorans]